MARRADGGGARSRQRDPRRVPPKSIQEPPRNQHAADG